MAYVVREDVGTTRRRSLSGHSRLKVWERSGGICVVCGHPIDGVRDRWIVEHIRALELGGADEFDNMGPAHEACGRDKTRDDHAAAAQAKRRKIRHLGAQAVTYPLPASKRSALKRKVDGTVVRRDDSSAVPTQAHGSAINQPDFGRRLGYKCAEPKVVGSPKQSHRLASLTANSEVARMDTAVDETTIKIRQVTSLSIDETPAMGEVLTARPPHLEYIFDGRPLLSGESAERYDALRASLVADLKPRDMIEAIWTKDIINFIWEAQRLRRWRSLILEQADLMAVEDLIHPQLRQADPMALLTLGGPSANALAASWVSGEGKEKAQVDQILQDRGLTAEGVRAHGFLMSLPAIERIDRMALNVDQRRDALLREIERWRSSFARQVRSAHKIIDAESWPSDDCHPGAKLP